LRLDAELRKQPQEVDWYGLVSIDHDVYDAISAEARSRQTGKDGSLSDARRAWLLTVDSDRLVAGDGVLAWLDRYAHSSDADAIIRGYELFSEFGLTARLREAVRLCSQIGLDELRQLEHRTALLRLDSLVVNPHGDGSGGRLNYARSHRDEFFVSASQPLLL
jgi:hypothetical protein